MRRPSPRHSSCRRRPWASGWSGRRRKIRAGRHSVRVPERDELRAGSEPCWTRSTPPSREGWTDPGGTDAARRELTEEALFLGRARGRAAAGRAGSARPFGPDASRRGAARRAREPRTATMCRLPSRTRRCGTAAMIDQAEALLLARQRHQAASAAISSKAALQSAHVHRCRSRRRPIGRRWCSSTTRCWRSPARRWWPSIAPSPSPRLHGAAAALEAIDAVAADARLAEYQPYWAARAELLAKAGAYEEARQAYGIAIGLERDPAIRRFLQRRQAMLRD